MQLVLLESSHDFEQRLFQAIFFYLYKKYGQGHFYICNNLPMAAILKNGYNFWTINARCMQLVLVESSHDFEQLLFQAFFSYLLKE